MGVPHLKERYLIMPTKLYVGNIPFKITTTELLELFSSVGDVISVTIPPNKDSGKPRGFAFIEMKHEADAYKAVSQLHTAELGGRCIMVSLADDRASAYNRPKAVNLGKDTCILCNKPNVVYGFNKIPGGVCLDCIRALSLATRSFPANHS